MLYDEKIGHVFKERTEERKIEDGKGSPWAWEYIKTVRRHKARDCSYSSRFEWMRRSSTSLTGQNWWFLHHTNSAK